MNSYKLHYVIIPFIFILFLFSSYFIIAAELKFNEISLKLSSQLRMRYEHYDGYGLKKYHPEEEDNLLLERIRIALSFSKAKNEFLFIQLQDAHAFLTHYTDNDFPDSNPIEDNLDIRQFYLQWLNIKDSGIGFRIGRQEISYGDQRLFGPGAWGNTGRYAWDAAMLKYNSKWIRNDLWVGKFLTYKSDNLINKAVKDFITIVDYAELKYLPFKLDVFYAYKRDNKKENNDGRKNLFLHSFGMQTEINIIKDFTTIGFTFAYQNGSYKKMKVNAYGLNAKINLKIPIKYEPRLTFQYTNGSGDEDPYDNKYQTFDGVYGGRDIYFYGYLNLFFWANLKEYEIDFDIKPSQKMIFFAQYNYFQLDEAKDGWYSTSLKINRRDVSGKAGVYLGKEIDMRLVIALSKQIEIMLGGGRFYPGTFIKKTGPAAIANWFFIQTTIKLF